MARLFAVGILLAAAALAVQAQLPPLPQQCSGVAEGPMPRSDLNWPTNQTKLAQELQSADKNKVRPLPCMATWPVCPVAISIAPACSARAACTSA
jgi:hypothetical protein